ncbi:MAG: hypothetical protein R3E79_17075 [Caldilineaceae bacterium]
MNTKNITKLFFVITLMLAIALGSGIAANWFDMPLTQSVYACSSTGGGGC